MYPSQEGGPSNTVYWMAEALVAGGKAVTIVTSNLGAEEKIPADVWMDTCYGRVVYHDDRFHLLPFRMLRSIFDVMPDCDVVHLNSLFYPPSFLSALMAMRCKKPIVWSPRGELDEKALVYSTWKKRPLLWLIRRFVAKRVVFHSTSPEESARIRAVFGSGVSMVEIPNFMKIPQPVETVADRPYLLCLGRIHPKKAIENLIEALALSRLFGESGFILKIAGDYDNPYGAQLADLVSRLGLQEKVFFSGLVEGDDKQKLYSGAYFSILPSHTENFGNVVIESLAQGTPVIASKGTPWEILEAEKAGIWTENSPEALALALDRIFSLSETEYQACRGNASRLARSKFDINRGIKIWTDTYTTISI